MSCLLHHLPPPPSSSQHHFQLQLFPRISLEFRVYKRRRLKCNRPDYIHHQRGLLIRNQLTGPFDNNLFQNLLSQFPSVNSLDLIAPALGFASGLAVYQSSLNNSLSRRITSNNVHDFGKWILFASPTPFNRFVTLRCPSIHFGEEADVNDKLVKEDTHFVRVNTGRIISTHFQNVGDNEIDALEQYQRVCVATDDGGVISLDWPAHLELEKEHGLDTTLLLVPGTPEGSDDWSVRAFASDCLKHGYFPVIMNPRGCAGSPLTTPRIFTAADSDDICSAIKFINRKRQWTTLMSVGWGYGANMLTKYLAEVEEKTPLTAATCIDNPFDLEEATRFSTYLNQKLTGGFRDILRSNKELFQGRKKGFDVEKGLLADSVRDFDTAISMISHGSEELQDFYSKSSTRSIIGNIKIPVLFIQNEDGSLPVFSIPRSLIAENPFTSLLLCSCPPSNAIASGRSVMSWCQNLTIEWLAAVELGLLKGRHPILKDVDVNINSSKGFTLLKGGLSDKETKFREIPSFTQKSLSDRNFADFVRLEEGDTLMIGGDIQKKIEFDASLETSFFDSQSVEEDGTSPEESERGKVLQTAQVVMNMLDLTMPSALTEEEKEKVLSAVGQGESLMKALQDAVPEDVRGKLTTAVAGILKTQGTGSYLDRLLRTSHTPNVSSSTKLLSEEKVVEPSGTDCLISDSHPQNQQSKDVNPKDAIDKNQLDHNHSVEPELQSVQTSNQSQSFSNDEGVNSRKDNISVTDDISKDDTSQLANYTTDGSASHDSQSPPGKSTGTEETNINGFQVNLDKEAAQLAAEEEKNPQNLEEIKRDSSTGQNNTSLPSETNEASYLPDSQAEGSHNQKKEDKGAQPVLDHVSNLHEFSSPTFSVSQALDALTGMDDSTQVAVNNVFGVIEDMITHFEEGKGNESDENTKTENNDEKTLHRPDDHAVECKILSSNALHDSPAHDWVVNHTQSLEEKNTKNKELDDNVSLIIEKNIDFSQGNNVGSLKGMINHGSKEGLVGTELLVRNSNEHRSKKVPSDLSTNSYSYSLYNDSFHKYLLSKIPDRKSADLDLTASLLLDYFPEDLQWKLLEQSSSSDASGTAIDSDDANGQAHCSAIKSSTEDEIIEPAYVILDSEEIQRAVGNSDMVDKIHQHAEVKDGKLDRLMDFVKNVVMDSLQVEVSRKLGAEEIKGNLVGDLEQVSKAVSLAVLYGNEHTLNLEGSDIVPVRKSGKVVTLHGEYIITAVSSALQKTSYLREILPLGVVVGSCLAALRKFFNVAMEEENAKKESVILDQVERFILKSRGLVNERKQDEKSNGAVHGTISDCSSKKSGEGALKNLNNDSVVVGVVTAALGASAVFAHEQQLHYSNETTGGFPESSNDRRIYQKDPEKLEDELSENIQNNVVTSLSEKALSVAAPVVPTKEDGQVDQDRIVAMLAELGQKGGILRSVGKIALLWGGIRGAVSLTDKLISFLHISERPLFHRVVGFVCMVLVLWSPVVVPLLPSLMQSWTMHNSSGIAEFCCIIGLYVAVIILVTLWGKRIRGFENSLEQYGLVVSWPKVQEFLKAFAGGALIVISVQSVNTFLGFARLSWQTSLHTCTVDIMTWMKVYGKIIMLAGRSIVTATAMAVVEELLFRSWLPEEISMDHGYHFGIVLSGLAFSLSQRSPQAIPGLWFLSLALAGARQKSQGDLSIPIGLHAGITATSYILQAGGFLTYRPNFSLWVTGTHPFEPFSGIVGLAFSFLMAVILYPRHPLQHRKKAMRPIRE